LSKRVYAINPASQRYLEDLSIWQTISPAAMSLYRHMHVWDAANGACIDFDSRLMGNDRLGVIIEESVLRAALLRAIYNQPEIVVVPHCSIEKITHQPNIVHLHNKTNTWQTKLLIAADGASSVARQCLGIAVTSWPYHHQAIVTTVQTELPHQNTAYQVFHNNGPLAFLPMPDPQQCSIVWSTAPRHAERLMALPDAEFSQQLTAAFMAKLGEVHVVAKRHQFALHMRHA
jgi:2-octaprenylphenol hydroxylase